MGWTGLYTKPSSIPAYFEHEYEKTWPDGTTTKCLGQAFVGRFVLYGVWERQKPGEKPYQFATVMLIRYKDKTCAWYYKDMDETVGPCEARCPKSLLRKLKTPAHNEYARQWRKSCWQYALGISRDGAFKDIRRAWNRDKAKARELIDTWNKKHPDDLITVTGTTGGSNMARAKNLWGKMRPATDPYAIVESGGWEWRILKAYQRFDKEVDNQFARYMCAVKSPYTQGRYDWGDVYVRDIPRTTAFIKDLAERALAEAEANI